MLESILMYSLAVYWFYHVVCQSDLMAPVRAFLIRFLPSWSTYPCGCALCFTFWVGVLVHLAIRLVYPDSFSFNPNILFIAPVINHFLGLIARRLAR